MILFTSHPWKSEIPGVLHNRSESASCAQTLGGLIFASVPNEILKHIIRCVCVAHDEKQG